MIYGDAFETGADAMLGALQKRRVMGKPLYGIERDAALRGYEFYNERKEGGEVAKGISFDVVVGDSYPLLSLQKIILSDSLIRFIIEELGGILFLGKVVDGSNNSPT